MNNESFDKCEFNDGTEATATRNENIDKNNEIIVFLLIILKLLNITVCNLSKVKVDIFVIFKSVRNTSLFL